MNQFTLLKTFIIYIFYLYLASFALLVVEHCASVHDPTQCLHRAVLRQRVLGVPATGLDDIHSVLRGTRNGSGEYEQRVSGVSAGIWGIPAGFLKVNAAGLEGTRSMF